jgi:hypothetical protein
VSGTSEVSGNGFVDQDEPDTGDLAGTPSGWGSGASWLTLTGSGEELRDRISAAVAEQHAPAPPR